MSRSHPKRTHSSTKVRVDDLVRKSRPYFLLEKQTRLLELQLNRLIVINGTLGKGILERDETIARLTHELESYRGNQSAEEQEAERQARLSREADQIEARLA